MNKIEEIPEVKGIIVVLIIVAFATGFITKCSFTPAPIVKYDTIQVNHSKDSLAFIQQYNSLKGQISILQAKVDCKDIMISKLRQELAKKVEQVQTLPVPERVQCFMDATGGGKAVMLPDSAVIPIKNIDSANTLIITGSFLKDENNLLTEKVVLKDSIISRWMNVVNITREYLENTENSFQASRLEVSGLKNQVKKEHNKRKWTTIAMGTGIAVLTGIIIMK